LGSGTDDQLLKKLATTHKDHPNFQVPKAIRETFTVIHTAKNVEYTITGFRNKNKDEVSKEIDNCITNSKNQDIVKIYQGICENDKKPGGNTLEVGGGGGGGLQVPGMGGASKSAGPAASKSKSDRFLGAKFRNQMKDLMTELQSCDVHFIRCLKPNELKRKDYFLTAYCLLQIR
jgi:myosin heavy subunit